MKAHSFFHSIKKRIITILRKLNIYPRLMLVFCTLLIASTVFITFFNQASYSIEMQSNNMKYLSSFVVNAMYKLTQQKEHFEVSMALFTRNENVLAALEENKNIHEGLHAQNTELQSRYEQNKVYIEQTLLNIKNRLNGVRALMFVSPTEQYVMDQTSERSDSVYIRDLEQFRKSEIYVNAVESAGYPSWYDAVEEAPKLFFKRPTDVLGIGGCVTLSYQVYSAGTKQPLGVLVCCIEPTYFASAMSEYAAQQGSNTYLVGCNGMVEGISASLSGPPFGPELRSLKKEVCENNVGSFSMNSKNGDLLINYFGNSDFPIHIVNLTYRDYVLEPVHRQGIINIAILMVVILVGGLGFYVAAISIEYPVKRLIRTMKKVGSGDFDAAYKTESHDEIGVLCKEFDSMLQDMNQLIDRVYVFEAKQKELELAEKTAQLDALQMQVNPHFLYNTLDMIRWECMYENNGESPASDMIEKFCTLLRMTIKGDKQKETIAESLAHSSTYLEVVNFRYTNKIAFEVDLDFDANQYLLPCLSLQPVLENAVRHGFGVSGTEARVIKIEGRKQDKDIILRIIDNGCGMSESQLEELRQKLNTTGKYKTNIGLRNVNQRCKLCYGEKYGMKINSWLAQGTEVIITVPAEELKPRMEEIMNV